MPHPDTLNNQVNLLNSLRGTPNRYQIISQYVRSSHEPRKVALVKYIGKQTLNVSGWLTPKELSAFLSGWFDAWETYGRTVGRQLSWRD